MEVAHKSLRSRVRKQFLIIILVQLTILFNISLDLVDLDLYRFSRLY